MHNREPWSHLQATSCQHAFCPSAWGRQPHQAVATYLALLLPVLSIGTTHRISSLTSIFCPTSTPHFWLHQRKRACRDMRMQAGEPAKYCESLASTSAKEERSLQRGPLRDRSMSYPQGIPLVYVHCDHVKMAAGGGGVWGQGEQKKGKYVFSFSRQASILQAQFNPFCTS